MNFKKIEIYRDEYDVILHKYKSELYPLNSVPFPPHYSNYSLDTIGGYSKILNLADSMCQTPGTNPTDKIIILLVNADGDTCTIYGQLLYCPTIEEYVIEFTSSFNDNEELDLDNLSLGIDDLASKLSFKLEGIKINDYEILIYDMLGKKHFTYIGETVNEDIIDISALNSGVYYFVYRANGQVITKIFTIVK